MPNLTVLDTPATVNFDYQTMMDPRVYLTLYGSNTASGAYILSTQTLPSQDMYTSGLGGSTKVVDKDFDLLFKSTQVMQGACMMHIGFGMLGDTNVRAEIRLRKYSKAGVESEIASTSSTTPDVWTSSAHIINIPETIFRAGDIFRTTVELHTTNSGAGAGGFFLHDPADRNYTGFETSQFIVVAPFRPFL